MSERRGIADAGLAGSGTIGEQGEGRPLGDNFVKWSTFEKIIERDHALLARLAKA